MQVTLKRAAFYAKEAGKAAAGTKYEPALRLSIHAPILADDGSPEVVATQISEARDHLLQAHEQALALVAANYAIRSLLADANMKCGVSRLLTEAAQLDAEASRVRALIAAIESPTDGESSPQAVLARAKANRDKAQERLYGREDIVTIKVVADSELLSLRKQLKRIADRGAALNDAKTSLNVSNHVTLDGQTVETLQRADILPPD